MDSRSSNSISRTQGAPSSAGAVDLGALKGRAEPGRQAPGQSGGGFEPFVTVTEAQFDDEVVRLSVKIPVVVLVGTDRSTDSQALRSTFEELSRGQRRFRVAYVDADATPVIAQALGVRVLPTVLALAAGRPVTSFEGNQPPEKLRQWVDALVDNIGAQLQGLGPEDGAADHAEDQGGGVDPRLTAASQAVSAGNFDEAERLYDELLASDSSNAEAKRARAGVAVARRAAERGGDPVAEAEAHPDDVDAQLAAADAELAAGSVEGAFDRLLGLVKQQPRAKDRLVEYFSLFEAGDPRVSAARTRLASALF